MRREEEQESRREEAVSVSCLEDKTNVWCTTKAPPKSFNYNQIEKTKKNKKTKKRKSRKIKPALMSYTHTHTGTHLCLTCLEWLCRVVYNSLCVNSGKVSTLFVLGKFV